MKNTETVSTKTTNPLWAIARHLVWAVLILPLVPLVVGCSRHAEGGESEKKAELPKVSVVNPTYKDLTREIYQPAYMKSYEETPIYTKIAGFAEEPQVDIGDYVKAGDLLVKLYVPEVERTLKVKGAKIVQAKADVKQAQAAALAAKAAEEAQQKQVKADLEGVHRADADVDRWKAEDIRGEKLLKEGTFDTQTRDEIHAQWLASKAARDEADAKYDASKATYQEKQAKTVKADADVEVAKAYLEVAETDYAEWKDWLDYQNVRAPYDGVITKRNIHKGHFLQPASSGTTSRTAEPLFEMMQTQTMRVNVQVPEADAVLVKEGDKAIVCPQALPGREFIGDVTRFTWSLNEFARTLRVEIWLKNPTGELRPGMYANVTILAKRPNAMSLPADAILNDIMNNSGNNYCFVVEDGKVKKLFVQVGARCDEGVEVLGKKWPGSTKWEPFTGKEVIVASNGQALQDGQAVEIKSQEETVAKETK